MHCETQEALDFQTYLKRLFTGSMQHHRKTAEKPRIGPRAPAWWTDDDEASQSSTRAMNQMGVGL